MKAAEKIDAAKADGRSALVIYLPAGYPNFADSVRAAEVAIEAGADIIEFGVPYTDPGMDGPVIQAATVTALKNGFRVPQLFDAVEKIADRGAAIEVMTYINSVYRYGFDNFARALSQAGGAGLITPDLVPDEADEWITAADAYDLDKIFLVAQSSRPERLAYVASASRGFVYAASTMGVTGARSSIDAGAEALVSRTRQAGAERVCLGLGVSTKEQAAEVAAYADGVIVGSAAIKALNADPTMGELSKLVASLREGVAC